MHAFIARCRLWRLSTSSTSCLAEPHYFHCSHSYSSSKNRRSSSNNSSSGLFRSSSSSSSRLRSSKHPSSPQLPNRRCVPLARSHHVQHWNMRKCWGGREREARAAIDLFSFPRHNSQHESSCALLQSHAALPAGEGLGAPLCRGVGLFSRIAAASVRRGSRQRRPAQPGTPGKDPTPHMRIAVDACDRSLTCDLACVAMPRAAQHCSRCTKSMTSSFWYCL